MKKVMLAASACVCMIAFVSCGGGVVSDARAIAQKGCECEKLAQGDDEEAASKCYDEIQQMAEDFWNKYQDDTAAMNTLQEDESLRNFSCGE